MMSIHKKLSACLNLLFFFPLSLLPAAAVISASSIFLRDRSRNNKGGRPRLSQSVKRRLKQLCSTSLEGHESIHVDGPSDRGLGGGGLREREAVAC